MNRKARRCGGIDVHKASLSACLRLQGKGRKVSEGMCCNFAGIGW